MSQRDSGYARNAYADVKAGHAEALFSGSGHEGVGGRVKWVSRVKFGASRGIMKFAFADPPYFGCGALYKAHHEDALVWDDLETHRDLIDRLVAEYPDGWVLCLSSPSLRHILPMCPQDCRIGAWVKPFCAFKANVTTAYAWEPVIWRGGRKRSRNQETIRDWVSEPITLQKGLPGAKPEAFCEWVLDLLNVDEREDIVDDLFPGTSVMGRVFERRRMMKQKLLPFAEGLL